MSDRLAVLPQYIMPKRALTTLAGKFASAHLGSLTTAVIRRFVARYNVNMAEAANPYGDGRAAARIVACLLHHFGLTAELPEPFAHC